MAIPFLLRDSRSQLQLKWSSELNSPIPVHLSSLIPRMLTFTPAISCLTTSNLPWFMDITFQVPVQYCSLQHRTLLFSPFTSTAGCCFCFGSIPSFFLELFLHCSILGTYQGRGVAPLAYSLTIVFKIILFIYLFHCWADFSLVVESRVYSSLQCFSLQWLLLLQSMACRAYAGFGSFGFWTPENRLSNSGSWA